MTLKDIDAIAVTRAPGLIGSLLVGLCFARGLSRATGKPLIEIDHIKAHLYANYLQLSQEAAGLSAKTSAGSRPCGFRRAFQSFLCQRF